MFIRFFQAERTTSLYKAFAFLLCGSMIIAAACTADSINPERDILFRSLVKKLGVLCFIAACYHLFRFEAQEPAVNPAADEFQI